MPDSAAPDFRNAPLDAVAVRVLGALIEKAYTTPDNYPLSLNALTTACNQSSNRDPVMALEEGVVAAAVKDLEQRGLVREVYRSESRVKRYRHALPDTLHLHDAEMAALGVLMLRGPQTVGEIRGRTSRMHEFPDLASVEVTLQALAGLTVPLVTMLDRQPGQKEARYAHLLSGEPAQEDTSTPGVAAPAANDGAVGFEEEMADLRAEVADVKAELAELRARFDAFRDEFR